VRKAQRLERFEDAQRMHTEFVHHLRAHEETFPLIEKAVVAREVIDVEARVTSAGHEAEKSIAFLHPRQRRAARDSAGAIARDQAQAAQQLADERVAAEQRDADAAWDQLVSNDPATVLATIEDAFADNEAPAAPIDCDWGNVTLLMRFPAVDGLVPTATPDQTPTGRPTIREYSKTERNTLHFAAMLSHAHATVTEAFAVAPGIDSATLLVISADASSLTAIYAAHVDRSSFERGAWLSDGVAIPAPNALVNLRGRTQELAPLSLESEADLSAVIRHLAGDLGLSVNPATQLAPEATTEQVEIRTPETSASGASPPHPALPTRAAVIPKRITTSWLAANVPEMTSNAYGQLVAVLRDRGWTDAELADRVAVLRQPR
jgi:hypothetical protein